MLSQFKILKDAFDKLQEAPIGTKEWIVAYTKVKGEIILLYTMVSDNINHEQKKIKVVVEVDESEWKDLVCTYKKIWASMQDLRMVPPPKTLRRKEFMREANIGSTTMNKLLRGGKIKFHRIGPRIISIPYEELQRYKNGEIE